LGGWVDEQGKMKKNSNWQRVSEEKRKKSKRIKRQEHGRTHGGWQAEIAYAKEKRSQE